MYVYMAITKDEYELPLAVADGPTELARLCRVTPRHVCHAIKAGGKRFIKVWIEDEKKSSKSVGRTHCSAETQIQRKELSCADYSTAREKEQP